MFEPKCMPFNVSNERKIIPVENKKIKGPAYIEGDHIVPCVWCNQQKYLKELHNRFDLLNTNLKLSNNKSVDDIINSNQWKLFVSIISSGNNLPAVCKERCQK